MSGVSWLIFAIAITAVAAAVLEKRARASGRAAEPREREKRAARAVRMDSARLTAAVRKVIAEEKDPAKVDEVARKLEAIGQPAAAAAAREHAAAIRSGKAGSPRSAASFAPPFSGVTGKAWNRYVRLMAVAEPDTVSMGSQLGIFQIGYRRLADLGYVQNLRKGQKNGRTIWVGDFKPPLTLAAFLSDPGLQYEVFVQATKADRSAVLSRYRDAVGKTFVGKKATLSGLLATAYHAGLAGLGRWLSSNEERDRGRRTSAVYQRTTGLF
jgi:hypothetical protein